MKQRIMIFFVMLWLGGCGGGGGSGGGSGTGTPVPGNTDNGPIATPVGAPDGVAVSAVIGAEGGELTSADGGVTLEIPAGALADDTTISIQPISNNALGGVGEAYRFSPDGLQTDLPMTLHFHLSDAELEGSALRFASIAFQDSDRHWRVYNEPEHDAATRTVSVPTQHFSDWSAVTGIQLRPGEATVKTDGGVNLQVQYCEQEEFNGIVSMLKYCNASPLYAFGAKHWSVNGVEGGSADTGTITPDADVSTGKAAFKAPHYVPGSNPVAVSVQVTDFDNNPNDVTLLVSHITIEQTLLCDSLKQVNGLDVDILFDVFEWSDNSPEESYTGKEYGHLTSTLVNQIPLAGRDASPIGYWTSQGQPHDGYVMVDETHQDFYPDKTVTATAQGKGSPYVAMDAPSFVSLIVDYSTCKYQLAAAFIVGGTVTVDNVSAEAPIGAGAIYYSEILPADAIDTGILKRDVFLDAKYDPDTKINGFYPPGQSGELRASGITMGHWTISVAN